MRLRYYIALLCTLSFYLGTHVHAATVSEKVSVKISLVGPKDSNIEVIAAADLDKNTVGLLAIACGNMLDFRIDKAYLKTNEADVAKFIDDTVNKVCK